MIVCAVSSIHADLNQSVFLSPGTALHKNKMREAADNVVDRCTVDHIELLGNQPRYGYGTCPGVEKTHLIAANH